jgi:hypothetical protein
MTVKKLHVPGHQLKQGGAPYEWDGRKWVIVENKIGKGLCTCGAPSTTLLNDNQRKVWHKEHRQRIVDDLPDPHDPIAINRALKNDGVTARVRPDPKRGDELVVEISWTDLCKLVDILQPDGQRRTGVLEGRVDWWNRVNGLVPEEDRRRYGRSGLS